MLRQLFLCSALLCICQVSYSQDWFSYSTTNTLPNNNIKGIAADSKNNKWVATSGGGLVKFDGNLWTVFNKSTTHGELIDDNLTCILIDSKDVKWIGTKTGLVKYDDESWQAYNSLTTSSGLSGGVVNCIAEESSGVKWIGTSS